jgi:transaldolase
MDLLKQLQAEGVSLWLDGVAQNQITTRSLTHLVRDRRITGCFHSPDVLADRLHDKGFARQLTDLALRGCDPVTATRTLLVEDLRRACDALAPVFTASHGWDGLVSAGSVPTSVEVAPAEARALRWAVDRPNLLLRVPVGDVWLPVVSDLLAEGIGVDAGPVYSPERYGLVLNAFFDGLERALRAGRDLSAISSVASFPLNRLDVALDAALESGRPTGPTPPRHRICTAVARLAYREYDRRFGGDRWRVLAQSGARPQRLLWTSTHSPGAAGPDTRHVDGFVAWGVANAMSAETLEAVAHHALLEGDTLTGRHISAACDLAALARLGSPHLGLAQRLEAEDADLLSASWWKLVHRVNEALELRRR